MNEMNVCSYGPMKAHGMCLAQLFKFCVLMNFFSVVEIIMCSNKNSKPGKMVQLLEYLPCRHEDLSSIPSIWVEGPVYLPVFPVMEKQGQEDPGARWPF